MTESRIETTLPWPDGEWRRELREAVRSVAELERLLHLTPAEVECTRASTAAFPLLVPRGFVARMRAGDRTDPLLLQVLPVAAETVRQPGYRTDPLGERERSPAPAVIQKYAGRALLLSSQSCPVHCRYCFRRYFPYREHAGAAALADGLARLRTDRNLRELILSGGDPLTSSDESIAHLVGEASVMPALRTLRIHTRMPIVLPERVDGSLLGVFRECRPSLVVVVHANHPNEIDERVGTALVALRSGGATVLNQSVLLAGVNDEAPVLAALSARLFRYGVLPYYLHRLDPVQGAAHFAVSEERARAIAADLWRLLPGYLVPRLVQERPGAASKVPLDLRLESRGV